jgi:hypothetical protein
MDEQKIQLESRLDYEHVRKNFMDYLRNLKDINKFSMEELETVIIDEVFSYNLVVLCTNL